MRVGGKKSARAVDVDVRVFFDVSMKVHMDFRILQLIGVFVESFGDAAHLAWLQHDVLAAFHLGALRHMRERQLDMLGALTLVHHVEDVAVFDVAVAGFAIEGIAITDHVKSCGGAGSDAINHQSDHDDDGGAIADQARAQDMRMLPVLEGILRGIADEAGGIAHLFHDIVAGVDTSSAGDALELQAIANIDAGGADLNAEQAIDAITQSLCLRVDTMLARSTRFTTCVIIGDDQRVTIEHDALEAAVGAGIHTDLLPHPAGIEIGGGGENADPDPFTDVGVAVQQGRNEFTDGGKIADEDDPGQQRDSEPAEMFEGASPDFVPVGVALVETHTGIAITFDEVFDGDEDFRPDGLWTGVATPDAAGKDGDGEQSKSSDDQKPRQQNEVLWPDGQAKEIETAMRKVEEQALTAVPLNPGDSDEERQEAVSGEVAQVFKAPPDRTRLDLDALAVELDGGIGRLVLRRNLL